MVSTEKGIFFQYCKGIFNVFKALYRFCQSRSELYFGDRTIVQVDDSPGHLS